MNQKMHATVWPKCNIHSCIFFSSSKCTTRRFVFFVFNSIFNSRFSIMSLIWTGSTVQLTFMLPHLQHKVTLIGFKYPSCIGPDQEQWRKITSEFIVALTSQSHYYTICFELSASYNNLDWNESDYPLHMHSFSWIVWTMYYNSITKSMRKLSRSSFFFSNESIG